MLKEGAGNTLESCLASSNPQDSTMCEDLAQKWNHLPEKGIFREGFRFCVLLLSLTDRNAFQHVLCSRTQEEIQGWKSAIEFHRHMYLGKDMTEETEFAAAMEEEMEAASTTVQEIMTRNELEDTEQGSHSQGISDEFLAEVKESMKNKQSSVAATLASATGNEVYQ